MSVSNSSQKFIARNRAPRVQIEYDVEVYGSEKKIELPFVMGVLADLSGKPVRYVRNHIGDMDRMPTPVRIASGRYNVVAKSSYCGRVTVPVIIKPGKTSA